MACQVQKNDEAERLAKLLEEEREKNPALMAQLSTKAEEADGDLVKTQGVRL